jgi:Domain of unknown function (DUF3576)
MALCPSAFPFRAALALGLATVVLAGCGGSKAAKSSLSEARVSTIAVNSYLWKAALETIGFMPLTQTDANSGVILSDWYANPQTPTERVKISVFVLDRDLRADAVRVNVQRQEARGGAWIDATVKAGTVQKLEDAILSRARLIRQAAITN